jgi:hypothetical protein
MRWANKYRVAPADQRKAFGKTYASKAEREYAELCHAMVKAGAFRFVLEQVTLWLGVPENTYRPDFFVMYADGTYAFVDVKGMETPAFKKTVKLWHAYGPCRLLVVKKSGKNFKTAYVVEGGSTWQPK